MSEQEQDAIDRFVENRILPNTQRIRLGLGIYMLATAGFAAGVDMFGAVLTGFLGAWMLGGWPAVKRLVRHPRMQLRHYWHVLRDTRRIDITEYPDGTEKVAVMRPKLNNGWYWTEVRGGNRD